MAEHYQIPELPAQTWDLLMSYPSAEIVNDFYNF